MKTASLILILALAAAAVPQASAQTGSSSLAFVSFTELPRLRADSEYDMRLVLRQETSAGSICLEPEPIRLKASPPIPLDIAFEPATIYPEPWVLPGQGSQLHEIVASIKTGAAATAYQPLVLTIVAFGGGCAGTPSDAGSHATLDATLQFEFEPDTRVAPGPLSPGGANHTLLWDLELTNAGNGPVRIEFLRGAENTADVVGGATSLILEQDETRTASFEIQPLGDGPSLLVLKLRSQYAGPSAGNEQFIEIAHDVPKRIPQQAAEPSPEPMDADAAEVPAPSLALIAIALAATIAIRRRK